MTWLLALLGLIGVVLNVQKNPACFWIWLPVNLALAVINFRRHQRAQGFLFLAYAVASAWGIWKWGIR